MKRVRIAALSTTLFSFLSVAQAGWPPTPGTTWQWQLTTPVNLGVEAEVYDIDLFDNDAAVVDQLHRRGRKAVCYLSAGSFENWRPDAGRFPRAVLGRNLDGWPGEKWLDIRRIDILGPILEARLDLCKQKGFDGVEPDNIDGYANSTGFPLSATDQLRYNRYLARAAHARGLAVALKNDVDQARELAYDFDFAINEQCFQYHECDALSVFPEFGKAVFQVEYKLAPSAFCPQANAMGFSSMKKKLSLNSWSETCWSPATASAPAPPARPEGTILSIQNIASREEDPLVPGMQILILGKHLATAQRVSADLATGVLPVRLGEATVRIGGQPARLVSVDEARIAAVVPFSIPVNRKLKVRVFYQGKEVDHTRIRAKPAWPGIFTASGSGRGQVVMRNQNGTVNSAGHRAARGSLVRFFVTGAGVTTPPSQDGVLTSGFLPAPAAPVEVEIGNRKAVIEYVGAAMGAPAGTTEILSRVPNKARTGPAVHIAVKVGRFWSRNGTTMAIANN